MALPKLIPRNVIFGNPDKVSPSISPDGKSLAYIAPHKGVLNVWAGSLEKKDFVPITNDKDRGIRAYFWAPNGKQIIYIQDKGGDENWLLYSTDLKTKQTKCLTPFKGVQARILKVDKHFKNEIIISINKRDKRFHDVFHLNLKSGKIKMVAKNPRNIDSWLVDAKLKVRGASVARPDAGFDIIYRETEKAEWRKIISWDSDDVLASNALGFTKDGKSLCIIDSRGANTGRLVEFGIEANSTKIIASDDEYDIGGIMANPDTYKIEAVTIEKDKSEFIVIDKSIAADISAIKKIRAGEFDIMSRDDADKKWIVVFLVDNGPAYYYLYNRENKKSEFLFVSRQKLLKYKLAEMIPIRFKSRDGLTIHGYITFPPSGLLRRNLPLVLNVHGGPWVRDTWGYNGEAQWFANRGYACLQINYRGSTGYGKKFVNAGDREWGGKMHDDLVDGVKWAIAQGYANPKRICIYGGSYGGYAALVGATFTPDLFCCTVDIVGPSNLITDAKTIPPYWTNYIALMNKRIGNPDTEPEFLKSRSPLFKVDNIKKPILIAHGKNDPRVKLSESMQIINAMKRKKIKYKFMLFRDEGHGFAKPKNKLKFYAAAEKFLAGNLGGRFEK